MKHNLKIQSVTWKQMLCVLAHADNIWCIFGGTTPQQEESRRHTRVTTCMESHNCASAHYVPQVQQDPKAHASSTPYRPMTHTKKHNIPLPHAKDAKQCAMDNIWLHVAGVLL